ncbi:hypothetical protein OG21DRAFT_1506544 [Imleria badia]|nr:hypothetical protein OG21DRAFT_1506544 [Imleria badia]
MKSCRSHRALEGYELCIHTCGCKNIATLRPRLREGGSYPRHAVSRGLHPHCNAECPGNGAFERGSARTSRTRNLTRSEIIEYLPRAHATNELRRLRLPALTAYEIETISASNNEDEGEQADVEIEMSEEAEMDVDEAVSGPSSLQMDAITSQTHRRAAHLAQSEQHSSSHGWSKEPSTEIHGQPWSSYPPSLLHSSLKHRSTSSASGSTSLSRDNWYPLEPSEEIRFDILYVPDPTRAMKRKDAERDLAWATREITQVQFDAIKDLSEFVYKKGKTENLVKVLVSEWLWVILQMDDFEGGSVFNLSYMTWEDFRQTVLHPQERSAEWNMIGSKHCVIGGIDYSIDHRSPQNKYRLSAEEFRIYQAHIYLLANQVQFWPPIEQVRSSASKWPTLCHLRIIAANQNRFTPSTIRLTEESEIPPNAVLKRSHSECGLHVILPDAKSAERSWTYLKRHIHDDEFWMAQEYVPSLDDIGEWRVIIIGGMILSVVHTYKAKQEKDVIWMGAPVDTFLSLDEVYQLMQGAHRPTTAAEWRRSIVNPQSGTNVVRQFAKREFHQFVIDLWKELVLRETRSSGSKPPIAIFCRMDIGIKIGPGNHERPEYFVNEVERTLTTSLWPISHMFRTSMGTMADTFAMILRQWLRGVRNAYIL